MKSRKNPDVVLRIDDEMTTMNWLKNFKRKLNMNKLDYKDNEYESSDFDPLNIVVHDSIKDKKKDIKIYDKTRNKQNHKFQDMDFNTLEV